MLMEITNTGKRRIRLSRHLYINPGQTLEVEEILGVCVMRKQPDIVGKIPKPVRKPKRKPKITIDFEEDELNDIK